MRSTCVKVFIAEQNIGRYRYMLSDCKKKDQQNE